MADHATYEFAPATCENLAEGKTILPFSPGDPNDWSKPFPIDDPFNLRKAVVPLYIQDTELNLKGLGTAFHIDEFGRLLTAEHVIAACYPGSKETIIGLIAPPYRPVVVLGFGLALGLSVAVPANAVAPVSEIYSRGFRREDPMTNLQSASSVHEKIRPFDVSVLVLEERPPRQLKGTIPVRLSGWYPTPGEVVFAVGFPELDCVTTKPQTDLLSERMFGAYGRIIDVCSDTNITTPRQLTFQVEGNWPHGMSGGPVFNESGEVIGLVSRGWKFQDGGTCLATAVCFPQIPHLRADLPQLDPDRPGWLRGWAVQHKATYEIIRFGNETSAKKHADLLGAEYRAVLGSLRIATDEFMSS